MSKNGLIKVVEHAQEDKEFLERAKTDPAEAAKEIGAELDEDEIQFLRYREGPNQTVLEERLKEYTELLRVILKWHMMKSAH